VTRQNPRSVIRAQKQVIRAQNVLIDWLLEQVEQERTKRLNDSPTRKEDGSGNDRESR
jgi:hypothetical protein